MATDNPLRWRCEWDVDPSWKEDSTLQDLIENITPYLVTEEGVISSAIEWQKCDRYSGKAYAWRDMDGLAMTRVGAVQNEIDNLKSWGDAYHRGAQRLEELLKELKHNSRFADPVS